MSNTPSNKALQASSFIAIAGGIVTAVAPALSWVTVAGLDVEGFTAIGIYAWAFVAVGALVAIAGAMTLRLKRDKGIVGGAVVGGGCLGIFHYYVMSTTPGAAATGSYVAAVGIAAVVVAGVVAVAGGALKPSETS